MKGLSKAKTNGPGVVYGQGRGKICLESRLGCCIQMASSAAYGANPQGHSETQRRMRLINPKATTGVCT